jgi:hypothetical protein
MGIYPAFGEFGETRHRVSPKTQAINDAPVWIASAHCQNYRIGEPSPGNKK